MVFKQYFFLNLVIFSTINMRRSRKYEEVFLAIGECAIIGTTNLDHMKKFSSPSVSVPSASPPLKIVWRSSFDHRWMCYNRHHQSWPYEEVFFAFGECSTSVTTIEDCMKKFLLVIGECAIIGTTNLNHMKKFSSPLVIVLSVLPPLKIVWRSFLGHRWMCFHRHHHFWPYVEIFFAFKADDSRFYHCEP